MNFTKYFPVPSDRMGFLWTLTSIEDCYVVEFGPAGTTHFAVEGVMELGAEHKMNVYTTHMSDVDITFGKHDKLINAIKEVDQKHSPKYIFVLASSVSSLVGIDIESICFETQPVVTATLIPVTTGGYDGDYSLGIQNALLTIVKNIVKDHPQAEMYYNIIGSNIDSYHFSADQTEIVNILSAVFGLTLNTCFTAYTSIDEIENASKAKYNIVLRSEGLAAAEYMKSRYGTPYVYKKPYGISGTMSWLMEIAKTFDLKINMNFIKSQSGEIKKYLSQYKSYLRTTGNRDVIIYGEYDTVAGMGDMVQELGLEAKLFVKHQLCGVKSREDITVRPSESDLSEVLATGCYAAFGDDTVRKLFNKTGFFQIANPNMDRYNFYKLTPLAGFNGMLYMLQRLMNFERGKSMIL